MSLIAVNQSMKEALVATGWMMPADAAAATSGMVALRQRIAELESVLRKCGQPACQVGPLAGRTDCGECVCCIARAALDEKEPT